MRHTYILNTVATTQYTTAIDKNAAAVEDTFESESIPGLRGDGQGVIKNIILTSKQNLAWQLELYDKDGETINVHKFAVSDGYQVSGGNFVYRADDIDWAIPLTVPNITVEIGVRNTSEDSKLADTDGTLTLKVVIVKG
jgi:hypothetical protein